jgi:peptidoglycan/LPS O-acetylase OafA/YrhL
MKDQRVYFPGLNSIRCIAVLLVIIAHIEGFKKKNNQSSLFTVRGLIKFIDGIGHQGVIIFFALSGFLITYLLLIEKDRTSGINIKKFYIRRALRIWPVYFLIIFLGFFVFPYVLNPDYFTVKTHPEFITKLFLATTFLPNAVFFIYGHIFTIGVLWSIGTEEQFYLVWPHLVKKIKHFTTLPKALLAIIAVIVVCKIILLFTMKHHASLYKMSFVGYHFLEYDAMLVGALAAVLYFLKSGFLTLIYKPWVQLSAVVAVVVLWFIKPDFGAFTNIIFAPIYSIIILNIATNPGSLIKIVNPVFEYLGKISYGMYLYHSIAIAACLALLNQWQGLSLFSFNAMLYPFCLLSTVVISALSYHFIEKPVLNYKARFMIVNSGSQAN